LFFTFPSRGKWQLRSTPPCLPHRGDGKGSTFARLPLEGKLSTDRLTDEVMKILKSNFTQPRKGRGNPSFVKQQSCLTLSPTGESKLATYHC